MATGFVFQAQDTFELIDADGSRALDHDEFREALRRMDLVRPTRAGHSSYAWLRCLL